MTGPVPVVRDERPDDRDAVRAILVDAFGGPEEAELVDVLRRLDAVSLALVAELDGRPVGHVLFSPVTVDGVPHDRLSVGLAPLAVASACQRRGVGTALARAGLARGRALGWQVVVVLGQPEYYARFGFTPAHAHGLACEFPCPPDAFMLVELVDGALGPAAGRVRYHAAFGGVGEGAGGGVGGDASA